MSVQRSIALKAAVLALLEREVPLPIENADFQDRLYALADALAEELATALRAKHPNMHQLASSYVREKAASFCVELLIPFTVSAANRQAQIRTEHRH